MRRHRFCRGLSSLLLATDCSVLSRARLCNLGWLLSEVDGYVVRSEHSRDWGNEATHTEIRERARLNYGTVALDLWHVPTAWRIVKEIAGSENVHVQRQCARLFDEVVFRTRAWPEKRPEMVLGAPGIRRLRDCALGRATVPGKVEARAYAVASRIRVSLLLRESQGRASVSGSTLARFVRLALKCVSPRHALECLASLIHRGCAGHEDFVWDTLSRPEYSEGHDDLHVLIRARLAKTLFAAGRSSEAWGVVQEALAAFRRLERKLRGQGDEILDRVQGELERVIAPQNGSPPRRCVRSASLESMLYRATSRTKQQQLGQSGQTQMLSELAQALSGRGTVGDVLSVCASAIGARRALVILEAEGEFTPVARFGQDTELMDELSWAVVTRVLDSGNAELYADALSDDDLASHRSVAVLHLRSLACVPLVRGGSAIGVLYIDHPGVAGLVSDAELPMLELVAAVIAGIVVGDTSQSLAQEAADQLEAAHQHLVRSERNRVAGELGFWHRPRSQERDDHDCLRELSLRGEGPRVK